MTQDSNSTTTLAVLLTNAGFDWDSGEIVWQDTDSDIDFARSSPTHAGSIVGSEEHGWPLNYAFDADSDMAECPRFVAQDKNAVYLPTHIRGKTKIVRIYMDLRMYLNYTDNAIPYPH